MNAFQSIRGRLLIFGLCISLIPIALITALYYLNARNMLKKQTLGWLTAIAESRKVHVLSFVEETKGQTVAFSSDGFIRDNLEKINHAEFLDKDEAVVALNRYLSVNRKPLDRRVAAIAIIDLDGRVVASTSETWIGKDMSDQEVFTQAIGKIHSEAYIGRPHHSPYLDASCIFISAPITSKGGGEKIGVIINAYDLAALSEITANRAGMGDTGEVLLGQRDGENIVFLTSLRYALDLPLSLSVPLDSVEADEPMRLALEGGSGALIAPDYRPVEVVAAYQYIPSVDWGLVAKMDKAEVFAPLRVLGVVAVALGLTFAAAVTGIGILFAISASRPIRKLTEVTKKFGEGELDYRLKVARKDEIGELANSFNAMAGELSHEIAEHERIEEELRKQRDHLENLANELTAVNKELESFCHAVSHDLRAPLRSIQGFSRALEEGYSDKLDPQGRDDLRRVRATSQHMGQLIDDLLNLSRITRSEMHREKVNLSVMVKTLAKEFQEMQPERQVKFVIMEELVANGDKRLLRVALNNMLDNAWKFTSKHPSARIEFGVIEHKGKPAYFIRDDGAGFDMAYVGKLFGPFQRLHSKAEFEGTGIGLATVQRIIHRHGGRVWAEGAVEKGATFYFTL
ncbi:MAG: ATP-binding protein [Candidatus Brocadiales bacterium]